MNEASQMAMLVMENSSELDSIISFAKSAIIADNLEQLAKHIFEMTDSFPNSALVEIKSAEEFEYYSSTCKNDKTRQNTITQNKGNQRIVQNDKFLQVNNENLTLLVKGLLIDNENKMGRLSDSLTILCDIADRFSQNRRAIC